MDHIDIATMAEKRIDEMMKEKPEEAVENDIETALEILLSTVGMVDYDIKIDNQFKGITPQERLRVVSKVKSCCEQIMEAAMLTVNQFGISHSRFVFSLWNQCKCWIEIRDENGDMMEKREDTATK